MAGSLGKVHAASRHKRAFRQTDGDEHSGTSGFELRVMEPVPLAARIPGSTRLRWIGRHTAIEGEIHMRTIRIVAVAVLIVGNAAALHVCPGAAGRSQPVPSCSVTISASPDARSSRCCVDLDPGTAFPSHTHPGEEIIYLIEGAWQYEIGDKHVTARAGDVLFIPAGTVHSARNAGGTNAAELATYVVEKGRPLLTLVK